MWCVIVNTLLSKVGPTHIVYNLLGYWHLANRVIHVYVISVTFNQLSETESVGHEIMINSHILIHVPSGAQDPYSIVWFGRP